jgi:amino acid transporter
LNRPAPVEHHERTPERQLSLFDSTSIIVGIIIGSGLYENAPRIAACVPDTMWLVSVWVAGGLFALVGAVCYAELATTYPAEGGDFAYLTAAFGRKVGFLFAWIQLWVVRPGVMGFLAFVFARYASELLPLGPHSFVIYAIGAVVGLAAVNIVGVKQGKQAQNVLAVAKVVGWLAVCLAGLLVGRTGIEPVSTADSSFNLNLAMIFILFAYSGWNEMAYVAAEVRQPEKNILRALLVGVVTVTAIYLVVNAAFLHTLGFEGVRQSDAIAADVVERAVGRWGALAISGLICISALGAMNGMTFTGARIYYAMGRQHRLFEPLGRWSERFGTPVWSLAIEASITTLMIVLLGVIHGPPQDAVERMVIFTAPPFWLFLGLTGVALVVLRLRDAGRNRPFRVPGYPITPAIFCLGCLFMLYSSVTYAWSNRSWEALWGLGLLSLGLALCAFDRE